MIDEATKKDLINIMKISSGFDGRNRQILRKIVEIGETTSHFKSALGQKFIRRAKELLADPTQKKKMSDVIRMISLTITFLIAETNHMMEQTPYPIIISVSSSIPLTM